MARTPIATDNFSVDASPLPDPPWGTYTGIAALRCVSGVVTPPVGFYVVVCMSGHNASLNANQYAQAVADIADTAGALMLYVRLSAPGAAPTGYELWSGFGANMLIRRVDDASTFVTLKTLTGHVLADGQIPSFEAVGTELIAYINGSEIDRYDTAGDGTKYSSGRAGLGIYWTNEFTLDFWANFECGNVIAAEGIRRINYHGG